MILFLKKLPTRSTTTIPGWVNVEAYAKSIIITQSMLDLIKIGTLK